MIRLSWKRREICPAYCTLFFGRHWITGNGIAALFWVEHTTAAWHRYVWCFPLSSFHFAQHAGEIIYAIIRLLPFGPGKTSKNPPGSIRVTERFCDAELRC